jgi:hypothetical protein
MAMERHCYSAGQSPAVSPEGQVLQIHTPCSHLKNIPTLVSELLSQSKGAGQMQIHTRFSPEVRVTSVVLV